MRCKKRSKLEVEYDLKNKSKVCGCCTQNLSFEYFWVDKKSPDGRIYQCIDCMQSSRDKLKPVRQNKTDRASYLRRVGKLRRDWKLTEDDYRGLVDTQRGCCAICRDSLDAGLRSHVDHDHTTGSIRGVLCSKCNHALGLFRDSITSLEQAIKYLKEN